jgi:transcriptional regulator with XRE-family HTH domain
MRIEREKRGLMQFQAAQRLGVSPAALCRYENEVQEVPADIVAAATRLFRCTEIADAACRECPVARARQDVIQKWPLGRGLRRAA